jgi:hypothetical protein
MTGLEMAIGNLQSAIVSARIAARAEIGATTDCRLPTADLNSSGE